MKLFSEEKNKERRILGTQYLLQNVSRKKLFPLIATCQLPAYGFRTEWQCSRGYQNNILHFLTNLTFLWLFLLFVFAVTVIKAQFALRKKKHPSIHVPRVSIPELGILWGIDFFQSEPKSYLEFKKLRRIRQRKPHIKKILCVRFIVLLCWSRCTKQWILSLSWHEWFSCEGKEWKIYCCVLALSSESQIWKFHAVIWQTSSTS